MDILFFLIGCLFLAETIDLFCNRDFLIFVSDTINPADYDIKKVYSVEKWLFAIDTLASYSISFHLGGMTGSHTGGFLKVLNSGFRAGPPAEKRRGNMDRFCLVRRSTGTGNFRCFFFSRKSTSCQVRIEVFR